MHRTHAGHGSIWPAEAVEARASLDAAERASRAREDALREAAGVARQAYMRAHRSGDDNSMEPDEIAAAIAALIEPKGGDRG